MKKSDVGTIFLGKYLPVLSGNIIFLGPDGSPGRG
jgi:hypothetical protein